MFSREIRILKNEKWYSKIAIEHYKLSKQIDISMI